MPQLELYENKEILDTELPAQISTNIRNKEMWVFTNHWHEHLELHYVVEGEATFYLNHQIHEVGPGDFVIVNSNELHTAYCKKSACSGKKVFRAKRYIQAKKEYDNPKNKG